MNERLDKLAKRLADKSRPENNVVLSGRVDEIAEGSGAGTTRRSLIVRTARGAAILGAGLVAPSPPSIMAAPKNCRPSEARYRVAQENSVITDALGTRFVRAGDNIVLDNPQNSACNGDGGGGGIGTLSTASQCGVSSYTPTFTMTSLDPNWSSLNCRSCPNLNAAVLHVFSNQYEGIGISYATVDGTKI